MSSARARVDKVELYTILVHTRESSRIKKRIEVVNVFGHTDQSKNRFTRRRRTQGRKTGVTGNIHAISDTHLVKGDNPNIVTATKFIMTVSYTLCRSSVDMMKINTTEVEKRLHRSGTTNQS